jgi:hypothetical protein
MLTYKVTVVWAVGGLPSRWSLKCLVLLLAAVRRPPGFFPIEIYGNCSLLQWTLLLLKTSSIWCLVAVCIPSCHIFNRLRTTTWPRPSPSTCVPRHDTYADAIRMHRSLNVIRITVIYGLPVWICRKSSFLLTQMRFDWLKVMTNACNVWIFCNFVDNVVPESILHRTPECLDRHTKHPEQLFAQIFSFEGYQVPQLWGRRSAKLDNQNMLSAYYIAYRVDRFIALTQINCLIVR